MSTTISEEEKHEKELSDKYDKEGRAKENEEKELAKPEVR